jgi:hypothetical protein
MDATNNTILEAALLYASQGFSVIPLRGKVCPIKWTQYQTNPAPFGQLHIWHRNRVMENVGIVCGEVSDNLAVIDLDGMDAVREFQATFPNLLDTYAVVTGSGKGVHYYFYCYQLPPTTRTTGFELRCDGCYVVAVPSKHPVTNQFYVPSRELDGIRVVENLDEVQKWIAAKVISKREKWTAEAQAETSVRNPSSYGKAALANACTKVGSAGPGAANSELNRQAFKMGFVVDAGHISYSQVVSELVTAAAALSERDGERATLATIKSGLDSGIERSRRESK